MSYNLRDYGWMVSDRVRTGAFLRALERVVGPDSVVIDIGTGTGVFALAACRLGARRVYAIEPDDVIVVAKQIAADNGLADRVTFIQETSLAADVPEPADVIISDIGGLLPYYGGHIPSIVDARERWLGAGGTLIPSADTLHCAVVETPELYAEAIGVWEDARFGVDMRAARELAVNSWHRGRVRPDQVVSEVGSLARIDYATVTSPDLDGEAGLDISRSGMAHGLLVWFDREVGDEIRLSNAPGALAEVAPEHIYGTAFFPWSRPVEVSAGDQVGVRLRAKAVDGGYVWRWNTTVAASTGTSTFAQSTFNAVPLSKKKLRARASDFRPTLNEEGRATEHVLELMRSGRSVGEIAEQLSLAFPEAFPSAADALRRVSELSLKFGI